VHWLSRTRCQSCVRRDKVFASLQSQRHSWIDPRRTDRRNKGRQQGNTCEQSDDKSKCCAIRFRNAEQHASHESCKEQREYGTSQDACSREPATGYENHTENPSWRSAKSHSNGELTSSVDHKVRNDGVQSYHRKRESKSRKGRHDEHVESLRC